MNIAIANLHKNQPVYLRKSDASFLEAKVIKTYANIVELDLGCGDWTLTNIANVMVADQCNRVFAC